MKTPTGIQDIRSDLAKSQAAQTSRRHRRRWLIAAGIAAVLVLFGFFGLPPIVKAQAIKHLSEALHRDVAIERVRINPLVPSITIDGLAIKDRDGAAFVSWKQLYVDFDWRSFVTGEWRFKEIALDGFSSRVTRDQQGVFNFADLLAPDTAKASTSENSKPPRPLRIDRLAVTDAAFEFADSAPTAPFATRAGPVSFTLTDFCTKGDGKAPYAFTAATEDGTTLAWKGTLSVDPVRSAGEFSLGGLVINKYAPYYSGFTRADILSGKVDASGNYAIDLGNPAAPILTLDGARLALSDFKLAARGSTAPVVELPSLVVAGVSADAAKRSAAIASITLDHPRFNVRRAADGTIDLLAMLTPPDSAAANASSNLSAPAKAPTFAPASAPANSMPSSAVPVSVAALPNVKLGEFAIHDLTATFVDETTPTPAKNTIEGLDLSVKNFSLLNADTPLAVAFAATLPPGGTMKIEGTVVRAPLMADLAINLSALPLAGGTPYVEPFLNLRIAGGTVSVAGHARLADGAASFQGDASVDHFLTVDNAHDENFVGFSSFALKGIDFTSRPMIVKIASVTQVDPVGRFIINADGTTNLASILRQPAAPAKSAGANSKPSVSFPAAAKTASAKSMPSPTKPAPALVWSVDKFTQVNGKFVFIDRSVKPAVDTKIDQVGGTITGLSSNNVGRGGIDFHASTSGGGQVTITGQVNPAAFAAGDTAAFTDIAIKVDGMDLSPFSPYVGTYAGYELAQSGLQISEKIHLAQRRIDSQNVVTLNQFTLGAATGSPQAIKLPVRLGVALLKDIHGNIVIDLPVNGSLDDPDFRIGRVVLHVVVNLLEKAATSPFSLIGSMFGGGGDELAYQQFDAGATLPLATEAKKLDTLRKALVNRPALNLGITGAYDTAADTAALRARAFDRQVRARLWDELHAKDPATPPPDKITVSPEDEARIVARLFAEKFPAGVVVKPDGEAIAVPAPAPTPPQKLVPYERGAKQVYVPPENPIPGAVHADHPIVTVSNGMKVEQVSAAPTLADMRRLLENAIPVSEDDLRHLAAQRAEHIRAALLEGGVIAPARLLVAQPAAKGARVLLQLQ